MWSGLLVPPLLVFSIYFLFLSKIKSDNPNSFFDFFHRHIYAYVYVCILYIGDNMDVVAIVNWLWQQPKLT